MAAPVLPLAKTTGMLENTLVGGQYQSTTFSVRLQNESNEPVIMGINGYYLQGTTPVFYVLELFEVPPHQVVTRENYYAQFEAFEFQFIQYAENLPYPEVVITAWGKDSAGSLNPAHRVLDDELSISQINLI